LTGIYETNNFLIRKIEPSPPSYSAIATSAALKGDHGTAIKAIQKAKETINAAIQKANSLQGKVKNSVPLFLKMRNEEVERECNRVEAYLNKVISTYSKKKNSL